MPVFLTLLNNGLIYSIGRKIYLSSYPYLGILKPQRWDKTQRQVRQLIWETSAPKFTTQSQERLKRNLITNLKLIPKTAAEATQEFNDTDKVINAQNLGKLVHKYELKHNFIVVELNLHSIKILYAKAERLSEHVNFTFDTYTSPSVLATTKLEDIPNLIPFMTQSIQYDELASLLLNMKTFLPLTTKSRRLIDVLRSVLTYSNLKLANLMSFNPNDIGHLIITGELPLLFTHYLGDLIISTIDALSLEGTWLIHIDSHFQTLLTLYDLNLKALREGPTILYVRSKQVDTVKLEHASGTYVTVQTITEDIDILNNHIHVVKIMTYKSQNLKNLMEVLPPFQNIKLVLTDNRKRPIPLGPTPSNNTQYLTLMDNINTLIYHV